MTGQPQGWAVKTIGDLCSLINGKAFKPSDWSDIGLPIVRIQNLNRNDAKYNYFNGHVDEKFVLNTGDLLFAWSGTPGTSFGAHVWCGPKAVLNQHIFNVRYDATLMDRDFLRLAINQTLDEQIAKAHGGVGLRHVTKGKFEETDLPVPPLPEQRRIVAKIDSLAAKSARARESLDHIPRLVEKYKQAILAAAFRGDLTRKWRNAAGITAVWKSVAWADAGETLSGKAFPSSDYTDRGVRLIRPGNLSPDGTVVWNQKNTRYLPTSYISSNHKLFITDSELIINLTAQSLDDQFLGRVCLSQGDYGFILNQRLAIFRPKTMEKKYCLYFLKSPKFRHFVDDGLNSGSLIQHIHTKQLKQFHFDVAPHPEQLEIVQRIETAFAWIDRLATEATSARKLVDKLDQAILAKAFRGELVPQDPNDEPASVLLDRIRAERADRPQKKARGRPRKSG